MNIIKIHKKNPLSAKIVLRLWLIMMLLVMLGVAFMWVVQIFLFEQNYIDSTVAEVESQFGPILETFKTEDLANSEQLLSSLSKSTHGKIVLFDHDGAILVFYNAGHVMTDAESLESMTGIVQYIMQSEEYQQISIDGTYDKIIRNGSEPIALEIGFSVLYHGAPASVILFHGLDGLHTVLRINRDQLVILSIILTLFAAVLAAWLSRYFVKPIRIIKDTVDSLAKGDLAATPGLSMNDELGQLSDSVYELGQALRRVDTLRKEVIANVSHELRAPLALIKGYAEMVRDINWKDDMKRNDDLSLIISEAGRMSEMVNDIMDYSQLQAGYIQLKKDWYNLCEIVESEIDHSRQDASEFGIRIVLESQKSDIPIHADALKISQVMRNLLNNAVNHTADHGIITVTVKEKENKTKVSVTNPGEPIPMEDREMIWERYQRSQHHGGRKKGTGIGLSIVSTFLKAHGMPYGVDCKDGMTSFWFECHTQKKGGETHV